MKEFQLRIFFLVDTELYFFCVAETQPLGPNEQSVEKVKVIKCLDLFIYLCYSNN